MEARFTFDRVASLYDEVRSGYLAELYQLLASMVPAESAMLEVGCGTGKATVGFAAHGLDIVALYPGASMIEEAAVHLQENDRVRFVQSPFEDWTPDSDVFDLIAAAQAWHWVPPEVGLAKAAALLRPDGVLAIFGSEWAVADPGVRDAIDETYARSAPELQNSPLGTWYLLDGPLPAMIAGSGLFRDLHHQSFAWARTLSTQSYLGMLRTLSNHQGLGLERPQALMVAVDDAARPFGDAVELSYETHLHYCRRS